MAKLPPPPRGLSYNPTTSQMEARRAFHDWKRTAEGVSTLSTNITARPADGTTIMSSLSAEMMDLLAAKDDQRERQQAIAVLRNKQNSWRSMTVAAYRARRAFGYSRRKWQRLEQRHDIIVEQHGVGTQAMVTFSALANYIERIQDDLLRAAQRIALLELFDAVLTEQENNSQSVHLAHAAHLAHAVPESLASA